MQRLVMRAGAKEIGEEDGDGHVSSVEMNEKTVAVLNKVGVRKWTAMQEEAMERLFLEERGNSRDGLICASTGSGKTYAFLMPVLLRLLSSSSSSSSSTPKVRRKIYFKELSMGSFFLFCGVYGILQHQLVHYSLFLIAQSLVFFAFGFNRVTF